MRSMLLALCGYARSGKDTVAEYLTEHHAFAHFSVGQPIKESLFALDPIVGVQSGSVPVCVRLSDIVDDPTDAAQWEQAKEGVYGKEVRHLLQALGNEASRHIIGDDAWADVAARRCGELMSAGRDVVVSSVRFPNEALNLRSIGGLIVRIERPGCGPVNDHPSETAMDDFPVDFTLVNDGTLDELFEKVRHLLRR